MKYNVIFAADFQLFCQGKLIIGNKGKIPWNLPPDLKKYSKVTKNKDLLVGYETFRSLYTHYPKSLIDRRFYILTRQNRRLKNLEYNNKYFTFVNSIDQIEQTGETNQIYCVGGKQVYEHVFDSFLQDKIQLNKVFVTQILNENNVNFDVYLNRKYFDILQNKDKFQVFDGLQQQYNNISFKFQEYTYISSENNENNENNENKYCKLVQNIMKNGKIKGNTLSLFGQKLELDLNQNLPVLTTKKMFLKGIIGELLWFLKGQTNNKILKDQGITIWNNNEINKNEDLGPIYGFQWRNFGGDYKNREKQKGIDQIQKVIDELSGNVNSRRAIVSAWNAKDLPKMALPPCHILQQYNITQNGGKYLLDLQVYQRSADIALGIPFNLTSYSILQHLIANEISKKLNKDIQVNKLFYVIGDSHIYLDHIENLEAQIKITPLLSPVLRFDKQKSLFDLQIKDISVNNYIHYGKIYYKFI